jgi:hypothetical protein
VAAANPMHGHTDHGVADGRQVHHRIGFSDSAPILAGDDIESKVKAGFNTL